MTRHGVNLCTPIRTKTLRHRLPGLRPSPTTTRTPTTYPLRPKKPNGLPPVPRPHRLAAAKRTRSGRRICRDEGEGGDEGQADRPRLGGAGGQDRNKERTTLTTRFNVAFPIQLPSRQAWQERTPTDGIQLPL